MDVPADAVRLLAYHQRQLGMRLDPLHAVGDVSSRLLQLLAPADVGRLVEAGGDLDQDRDLLAAAGRLLERLDDRGAAAGAVDRELDRQNGGIGGGALQEPQDRGVEAVVRQVHQDVTVTDFAEDRRRVGVVQFPQPRMGHRLVRRVALPGMAGHGQVVEVRQAQQPGSGDDVGRTGAELSREPVPQAGGRAGADLYAYHARVLPGGQLRRDHPDDRTGREVHVLVPGLVGPRVVLRPPGDPEEGAGRLCCPREEHAQVVGDHLLQGHPARLVRQRHPSRPVGRHLDPHETAVPVTRSGDQYRQVEAEVADERERMGGIGGQRG